MCGTQTMFEESFSFVYTS